MSTEWTEETIREHMFTEVELSTDGARWFRHTLCGFCPLRHNPFIISDRGPDYRHMRLIPKTVKRIMTIKELWGKTLINECGSMMTICNSCDGSVVDSVADEIIPIQELHSRGWKLAGPDLEWSTATSLMIEVDE